MVKIDYDSANDSLYLYKEREKAKFNVEVLKNFIIDVNSNNKFIGLEILNASKILDIKKGELKDIKKAHLSTLIRGNTQILLYNLQLKKASFESRIQVPVSA